MTRHRQRQPTSPGEILREEFMEPLGLSTRDLAAHIGCEPALLEGVLKETAPVTATLALQLGAAFETTPEFWLNAQKAVDLYRAEMELGSLPEPLPRAS